LASAEDRLQKLKAKLVEFESTASEQVPALQARIKEAELKISTTVAKLATLKSGNPVAEETLETAPSSDIGTVTNSSNKTVVPTKTLATSQQQLLQWQQQLQGIQAKIAQAEHSKDENLSALQLSEQVLLNKINQAEVSLMDDDQSVDQNEARQELDPLQRAMMTAMAKANKNDHS